MKSRLARVWSTLMRGGESVSFIGVWFIIVPSVAAYLYLKEMEYMLVALTAVCLLDYVWDAASLRSKVLDKDAALADKEDDLVVLRSKVKMLEEEVGIYKALTNGRKENPIKSNRIVGDKTFAVRLRSFVAGVNVCDAASDEEKEYLLGMGEQLLKWQTKTVRKDTEEYKYLERLGLMPEPAPVEDHAELPKAEAKPKRKPSHKKKPKTTTDENKD